MGHSFGLIRQTIDVRDRKFIIPRRITVMLPASFDLSNSFFGKVPQLDQQSLGSCGPHTAAECIDDDELSDRGSFVAPSRLFIYYVTRMLAGTVNSDSGVNNRQMMKALAQYGFCPESMLPYSDDPTTFRIKPSPECFSAALANRILGYYAVQVSLDQIKGALVQQARPIVFGFDVFRGIESQQAAATGVVPDPSPGETPIGGHDVSLIGYDDVRGVFKFRNHWMEGNRPWGDRGYGYLSYAYATSSHVSDLWVIDAVTPTVPPTPGPTPPPTPTPVPPPGPVPPGPTPHGWHAPAVAGQAIGINLPAKGGETYGIG